MKMNELPTYFKEIDNELWFEEVEVEKKNLKITYKINKCFSYSKSPYQEVALIDSAAFGPCLVLDGVMQTTSADGFIYNEMITHIPVLTHKNPRKVLVIGGGDCGAVRELSKYEDLEIIDMVELDEVVTKECIKFLPEISGGSDFDKRINFKFGDGVEYVKSTDIKYDIIMVDSPDPEGPAKDLFGEEFYKNVKKTLNSDGVMVCQSESPMIHRNIIENTRSILKKNFKIVKTYIAFVPTYPGGLWSFTMASDVYDPSNMDVSKLPFETRYLTKNIAKSCFDLPNFISDLK
ncbi:polyamine aminopropyltransferase [Clostridium tagluense]|uniref:Polyamine aminopropyltransferase n=1 Tax=Clostridium tagluense TaxID=360422 RepID=A0A401UN51_9CLOT|nr:polyamine aminopropyltransferase [Clostridium tagluense]MBU3129568.1 polyamine aminopropyltransferase [Clostridium tagluense]MBW9157276.1 polyamine aminopropyltransferase [Clostridium tagluense]MCB2310932.1 polyamine aminopropyltransferase [Clostridium tagluense]MCB2315786.1 polyamine aminopropyltransferase [Clostridium tagluense]MCB2320570.1 polyamine aminopropyltransferase [Clostridium tagluense]